MVLAEQVSQGATSPDHHDWPFIQGWAEELGLSASTAITKISGTEHHRH